MELRLLKVPPREFFPHLKGRPTMWYDRTWANVVVHGPKSTVGFDSNPTEHPGLYMGHLGRTWAVVQHTPVE